MSVERGRSMALVAVLLLPVPGFAADVKFTVPPAAQPAAQRNITVCIPLDGVRDLRVFEQRPKTPDIPSLYAPHIPKDRCIGRNRSAYGKAYNNILIAHGTVQQLAADTLANAFESMGFKVVRDCNQAPQDAVRVEILIDRMWGWMEVPQARAAWGIDDTMEMNAAMETRVVLSKPGGGSETVTITGDGRMRVTTRLTPAWQKAVEQMLASYMNRAQQRLGEMDFAALGTAAGGSGADPQEQLRKLKKLYDDRLITEDEYQKKRKEILDRI